MPSSFEEDSLVLSERLVLLYEEITRQIARAPAIKASTREELFRRLELAKEYIHGAADGPVSLDDVAREACLSDDLKAASGARAHSERLGRNGCLHGNWLFESLFLQPFVSRPLWRFSIIDTGTSTSLRRKA